MNKITAYKEIAFALTCECLTPADALGAWNISGKFYYVNNYDVEYFVECPIDDTYGYMMGIREIISTYGMSESEIAKMHYNNAILENKFAQIRSLEPFGISDEVIMDLCAYGHVIITADEMIEILVDIIENHRLI